MTRDELTAIGRALHGDEWQTPLARDLAVSARTVRRWLAGDSRIDDDMAGRIRSLVGDMPSDLDRYVKIGGVKLPRWLAARDALGSDLEDELRGETGYLVHLSEPRFVARWCVGEAPLSALSYTDSEEPGEGADDTLSLYDFVWTDRMPGEADFGRLMRAAVAALDNFINVLGREYC